METTELLAKILANENLFVRKANISTAAFDLVNRELLLPMWKDLQPVVETMLVEHETGHALFTPLQYKDEIQKRPFMASILNVIEDMRIERLFKERYPGSRKDFASASKILRETDFFELNGQDLSTLNLIDRINIYSKLGVLSGVKFEQKELVFVQRASRTVTFDEVVQLADDIYAFMKEEFQEETRKSQSQDLQFGEPTDEDVDGEEIEMDFDADGDEDFDYGDGNYGSSHNSGSEYLQSKTDDLLKKKLEEAAGVGTEPYYFTIDEEYDANPVIGYKEVLLKLRRRNGEATRLPYEKFKTTVSKQVGHLVQQFELKKAAEVYARRRITKTGYIDVNKISQYKVKDDIFKRNIKVSEGQNHGMIMLLDWSRSMMHGGTIYHSLDQVMQLVMFCRSVGIPYRVYAFADKERGPNFDYQKRHKNHNGDFVNLLEFFSNDMTLAEHNEMMAFMTSRYILSTYNLTYTPLGPAILAMRQVIPGFKAKYNVQKLNFITFTDGANTSQIVFAKNKAGSVYVRDTVLNKNFVVTRDYARDIPINEINAFYSIIKERFNCTVTTFFVTNNVTTDCIRWSGVSNNYVDVLNKVRPDFKSKGFAMITGYGRDAIYFVNSSILKTSELNLDKVTSDMTSSAIARNIRNGVKSSLKNKILIEKFADSIC